MKFNIFSIFAHIFNTFSHTHCFAGSLIMLSFYKCLWIIDLFLFFSYIFDSINSDDSKDCIVYGILFRFSCSFPPSLCPFPSHWVECEEEEQKRGIECAPIYWMCSIIHRHKMNMHCQFYHCCPMIVDSSNP